MKKSPSLRQNLNHRALLSQRFRKSLPLWLDATFIDIGRQFRLSYLPPLMVYLALGVSSLSAIVGLFFIKDYLNLSAAFLAGLGFWAGIPWILKMPLGHMVDLIWQRKSLLVYVGAILISTSLLIMYGLIAHLEMLLSIMSAEAWFVTSSILAPTGYVLQDVVADAMTVEAIPKTNDAGEDLSSAEIKTMHTTMQTLGRMSLIGGSVVVALLNLIVFSDIENMNEVMKLQAYANIYLIALVVPVISISGVVLGSIFLNKRAKKLKAAGYKQSDIQKQLYPNNEKLMPNWWILGGSLIFVIFTLSLGVSTIPLAQEIIFIGSMFIIVFLMYHLLLELNSDMRKMLIGTAFIIFIFRAMPSAGPSYSWFQIDELGFDQLFLSKLSLIASILTIFGMLVLRPMMANRSIAFIVVLLTLTSSVLFLPNIGLYFGIHDWTAAHTNGLIDARFIALIDTMMESPLGQISMIPMLAWIANNAPPHLKATFFAVMASFTNLAISASSLGTKYLNEIFTVTRQVSDRVNNIIISAADYSELGNLLIVVGLIGLLIPLLSIFIIQKSRFNTQQ